MNYYSIFEQLQYFPWLFLSLISFSQLTASDFMRNDSFVIRVHDVGNDSVNDFNDRMGYIS